MFLTKVSGEFSIVVDGKIKDDADFVEYPEIRVGDRTFKRVKVNESLNRYLRDDLRRQAVTIGLINQRRIGWIIFISYLFSIRMFLDVNIAFFVFGTLVYACILAFVQRQAKWRIKWINVDGREVRRE